MGLVGVPERLKIAGISNDSAFPGWLVLVLVSSHVVSLVLLLCIYFHPV